MENNIITQNTGTPEYSAAISLHQQIIINGRLAAEHLVEMCRCIKQMRDEKLYISLGYEDFGNYCEDMLKIKARQGYSYIKIYEDLPQTFLQSNANLGVTKLELLTHVNPLDREEFVQNTNLNEITVNELKAEIERLKTENCEKGEQLSMFEKQNSDLENKVSDLEKELTDKPAEVVVREPDPAEIEKLVNEKLEETKDNSDAQKAIIEHYLKMAQTDIQQLCSEIDKFEDEEKKAKYKGAIAKFLSAILESLGVNYE